MVVNYLRKAMGQQTGGHISPLAAYDAKADRFLILDVARYKYPPVWVKASDLFDAMNTTDSSNDNKTRGYVLIAKAATDKAATDKTATDKTATDKTATDKTATDKTGSDKTGAATPAPVQ